MIIRRIINRVIRKVILIGLFEGYYINYDRVSMCPEVWCIYRVIMVIMVIRASRVITVIRVIYLPSTIELACVQRCVTILNVYINPPMLNRHSIGIITYIRVIRVTRVIMKEQYIHPHNSKYIHIRVIRVIYEGFIRKDYIRHI